MSLGDVRAEDWVRVVMQMNYTGMGVNLAQESMQSVMNSPQASGSRLIMPSTPQKLTRCA